MGLNTKILDIPEVDESPAVESPDEREERRRSLEERYANEPSVLCRCTGSFIHRGRSFKRGREAKFPVSVADSLVESELVVKIEEGESPAVVLPKRGRPSKSKPSTPDTGPPAPPADDDFDLK